MGVIKRTLQNRKGDTFVFILILIFFILTLAVILMEYFRMESLYQQVEYVLQRGINSAVEYAIKDEYRRDGYAIMDTELAKETLYDYLYESMELDSGLNKYAGDEWVYELEIENFHASESPPQLTLDGTIRTHSIFAFLPGEIELPFSISSVNTQFTEGGSQ